MASLVTVCVEGDLAPDSSCPTYELEVLMREATSACVRDSSPRRLRITSPKSASRERTADDSGLVCAGFAAGGRMDFFVFKALSANLSEVGKNMQDSTRSYIIPLKLTKHINLCAWNQHLIGIASELGEKQGFSG